MLKLGSAGQNKKWDNGDGDDLFIAIEIGRKDWRIVKKNF